MHCRILQDITDSALQDIKAHHSASQGITVHYKTSQCIAKHYKTSQTVHYKTLQRIIYVSQVPATRGSNPGARQPHRSTLHIFHDTVPCAKVPRKRGRNPTFLCQSTEEESATGRERTQTTDNPQFGETDERTDIDRIRPRIVTIIIN